MIQLGYEVKDIITGLTGVAVARTEWLYGCARVAVQPKGLKDGKPYDEAWMDEQRVSQIGNEMVISVYPATEAGCELGNEVRDKLTGFSGIASAITHWVSGETTITVEPPKLHEGKPVSCHGFNAKRIELIEKKAPPVSAQSSARSGGPQNDPVRY